MKTFVKVRQVARFERKGLLQPMDDGALLVTEALALSLLSPGSAHWALAGNCSGVY